MKQNKWFLGFYIQDAPFLKCHKKFNLKLFMRLDLDVFRDAIFMMGVLKNENDQHLFQTSTVFIHIHEKKTLETHTSQIS